MKNNKKDISDKNHADVGNHLISADAGLKERRQEIGAEIAEDELAGNTAIGAESVPAEEMAVEIAATQEPSLKKKTVGGVMWRMVEVGGAQVIQFVISVVLARLIMPEQFAALAMLGIFTAVAGLFVNSGFGAGLMRKPDRTQTDCSTVFYFNIVMSTVCYGILWLISPWVADFYDMPVLKDLLRVTSLGIIIGSFGTVQGVLMQSKMEFKRLTKLRLSSMVISGIVGMAMAFKGFQVWALVGQSLVSNVLGTIWIWRISTWRPTWEFSWGSFRELFGFGSKLLASSLLDTLYSNMYSVIIGKLFAKADLAYYNRASSLSNLTTSMPTGVLQSVTFPALCAMQSNDAQLRENYRKMIRISSFVIFPLSLGIGAVAYPLINVLYTEVWIFSASLLQIVVFSGMWYPIHALNLNVLQVKGRSDLFLRLEVIKKIMGVTMLCVTVPLGLKAICYGGVVTSIIALFINTHYTSKLLDLSFWKQLRDIWPSLLLALVMYLVCTILTMLLGDGIVSLIAGVGAGVLVYAGGAYVFKFKELYWLKTIRK